MTKYITNKSTTVWKQSGTSDVSLAVRTLSSGTVIDVISEGQAITSWSTTPTLNIGNGEYVNKSDAVPYNGILPSSIQNIPTPVKAILGLAFIFVALKVVKVI